MVVALLATCGATSRGADMDGRFYSFTPGTQWTFDATFPDGAKRTEVFRVTSHSDNQTEFERDIFNPPDPGATASSDEIWYVQDGYVVWGDNDLQKITPYWRVYKLGSKAGDTWEGPSGRGTATHMGTTEVTVPAGTYRDVIHIRLTDEIANVHDFYYAPTVGLVRWDTSAGSGRSVLVLRKFIHGAAQIHPKEDEYFAVKLYRVFAAAQSLRDRNPEGYAHSRKELQEIRAKLESGDAEQARRILARVNELSGGTFYWDP